MNIAIIGAGHIAEKMAATLNGIEGATPYAIAARDLERAEAFAKKFNFEKAYGSYEDMLEDPEVELVYVATPHNFHAEHAKLCLNNGKPVLVEKPFTINAKEAKEVLDLAKEKNLFVGEAIWTRYMPMRDTLNEIIQSGIVGKPYSLYATLSYAMLHKERILKPELAGGGLLDIGVYCLNFASMVFGDDFEIASVAGVKLDTGVDAAQTITLTYSDGKMATLRYDVRVADNRDGVIYCENGYIEVTNINDPEAIDVFNGNHELIKHIDAPAQITGFEYQVDACQDAIKVGKIEAEAMPHDEIMFIMEQMDAMRKMMDVFYPGEE